MHELGHFWFQDAFLGLHSSILNRKNAILQHLLCMVLVRPTHVGKMVKLSVTLVILVIFTKFSASDDIFNSTNRTNLLVKPVNLRLFTPCFRKLCFKDLGCFVPYIVLAYLSLPPFTVCPQDPEEMGVRFMVLSQGNYDEFEALSAIKPKSSVAFLIHGILSEYDEFMYLLPAYLLLKDYDHVVLVDWSIAANPTVVRSVPIPGLTFFVTHANVEVVGRMVCLVIQEIAEKRGIEAENILLVGFSAGGNMIAFTAEFCRERFDIVVERCTAVEMSGVPYYFTNKPLPRSGHCRIIDCVHATYNPKIILLTQLAGLSARFGVIESNCDSDYYINYPLALVDQPGCSFIYFCSHVFGLATYTSTLSKCSYEYSKCNPASMIFGNQHRNMTKFNSQQHGPLGAVCVKTSNKPLQTC